MRNLIFLALPLICSCVIRHDTFFDKPSKSNVATPVPLRMDGAYYAISQAGAYQSLTYVVLYRNGIALEVDYDMSKAISNDPDTIRRTITGDLASPSKAHITPNFGGFAFTGDTLYVQHMRYYPEFHWENATLKGKIIDDSTIYMSVFVFPPRPKAIATPFYLHFLPMDKPDSLAHNPWKGKRWYWKE